MATALITGASGLIGSRLLQHWSCPGLEPVVIDHHHTDLLGSGVPTAMVARHRPEVVVHLAWCASGTPNYRDSAENTRWVDASLELAAAARNVGAHAVLCGTALDGSAQGDAYTRAKVRLREALAPHLAPGVLTWLRPFYVFSPDSGRPQLVADALQAKDEGQAVSLRTPGSSHDFVHVDDVARAVVACVSHRLPGTVDIGTGKLRSVQDLVLALGARPSAPALQIQTQSLHHHDVADTSALTALGWRPSTTEEFFRHA